jgi:putative PIG3 family NAD(P)H quinone oxidoreductase
MRAAIITAPGGPEVLRIEEVPTPEPVADQVRVRVHTSGLNRADLLQRAGRYPAPPDAPASIPGLEIAGEVDAVGPRAHRWKVGDRVFGLVGGGAHAEFAITPQDLLAPIPSSLDFVAAGAIPEVYMTAYDALFPQAQLTIGERVLVHAAGSGVGTAAVQLARAAGAAVWGTVRTESKRDQALATGLTAVFGPDNFAAEVRAATGGAGVDVLLDFVGAPYLQANLDALAPRGRMVMIGTMGGAEGSINLGLLMGKRLRIFGTVLRSRSRAEKAALTERFAAHVGPLLASGQLQPIVDRVFPLEAIGEAHSYMASNRNFGKIVLQIATDG